MFSLGRCCEEKPDDSGCHQRRDRAVHEAMATQRGDRKGRHMTRINKNAKKRKQLARSSHRSGRSWSRLSGGQSGEPSRSSHRDWSWSGPGESPFSGKALQLSHRASLGPGSDSDTSLWILWLHPNCYDFQLIVRESYWNVTCEIWFG